MLVHFAPASGIVIAMLIACFVMVLAFEATNGFHDTRTPRVRVLSAPCLGVGTMVGYKRVARPLGERLGKSHMTPGQGASSELVGSALIGVAGFAGLPVGTTRIITSGIAGTMVTGGQGLHGNMVMRIVMAWVFTLPATILIAGALFHVLDNPGFRSAIPVAKRDGDGV